MNVSGDVWLYIMYSICVSSFQLVVVKQQAAFFIRFTHVEINGRIVAQAIEAQIGGRLCLNQSKCP